MELEWDEDKRQETLTSRGLDFAHVADVDFSTVVTVRDDRHDYGEPRFSSYGYLNDVLINFV